MDRLASLTLLVLAAIALVTGGIVVRLGALAGDRSASLALAFVAAVLASVVVWVAWSRRRSRTPYW